MQGDAEPSSLTSTGSLAEEEAAMDRQKTTVPSLLAEGAEVPARSLLAVTRHVS